MALNFSHRQIFPAHVSEDNLVPPMRIVNGYLVEGIPEKNGEGFARPRGPLHVNREIDDSFDYGRDRVDRRGSPESVSKDIIDLLPPDPFGMDISTTFTAISGWIEDLQMDYRGYGSNNVGASKDDYGLFAGLNLIWSKAMSLQSFPSYMPFDDKSNTTCQIDRCIEQREVGDALHLHDGFSGSLQEAEEIVKVDDGNTSALGQQIEKSPKGAGSCSHGEGGATHGAFGFVLNYLGVRDIISMEKVCRSLRSEVRSDPLYWRNFHINHPLNERITDDLLLQLTARAEGNLQCLSLVECPRISDDGLKRVLESNPMLTKLCVPGCTRLSIDGIVNSLKAFMSNKDKNIQGIKHLRIGGLFGVTYEHFEELKMLLGADTHLQQNVHKPHFYHRGNFYLLCDDDRAIDIEMCPRCQKLRIVYDCPAEGCLAKDPTTQICRGCTLCIARCIQCGRCINDGEYEETFCLEFLCALCFKQLPKYQEGQDKRVYPTKNDVHG